MPGGGDQLQSSSLGKKACTTQEPQDALWEVLRAECEDWLWGWIFGQAELISTETWRLEDQLPAGSVREVLNDHSGQESGEPL